VRLIRWTTEAAGQFEAAVKHIHQDNPTAGRNVAQAVIDRIEQTGTSCIIRGRLENKGDGVIQMSLQNRMCENSSNTLPGLQPDKRPTTPDSSPR
jgi:hypothetical protein